MAKRHPLTFDQRNALRAKVSRARAESDRVRRITAERESREYARMMRDNSGYF
jgi:hypothetical protein